MATTVQRDFFRDGFLTTSCFQNCDSDQSSAEAPSVHNQLNDHSEMKETEDLLASEMNKLSVQERSKALDDLHCVGEELKETTLFPYTTLFRSSARAACRHRHAARAEDRKSVV